MDETSITKSQRNLLTRYYEYYSRSGSGGVEIINTFVKEILNKGWYSSNERVVLNSIRKDVINNDWQ